MKETKGCKRKGCQLKVSSPFPWFHHNLEPINHYKYMIITREVSLSRCLSVFVACQTWFQLLLHHQQLLRWTNHHLNSSHLRSFYYFICVLIFIVFGKTWQEAPSEYTLDEKGPPREAKWWYSTFHTVTAMVGAGVLSLPYAMAYLGWYTINSFVLYFFKCLKFAKNLSNSWKCWATNQTSAHIPTC